MSKCKKLFSLLVCVSMFMSTLAGLNASANSPDFLSSNNVIESSQKDKQFNFSQQDALIKYQLDGGDSQSIKAEKIQMKDTGKKLSLKQDKYKVTTSRTSDNKANNNNDYASFKGKLTNENKNAFYLFSKTTKFLSISKMITKNQNYTLTLGHVDYQKGEIYLYDYVIPANQQSAIMLDPGDYAWVIQSKDASYGDEFTLQYNVSLSNTDSIIYITENLELYTYDNLNLKLNNQIVDLDYKYNIEWKTNLSTGPAWHTEKIWLENPNTNGVVHVGGFQLKHGNKYITYPHSIVLNVSTGGTFTHYLDQNPPRVFHDSYDVVGKYTPRAIDSDDIEYFGSHYLIYDIDSGTVKEFVSGLSREWSKSGDKSQPKIIN